MCKYMLAYDFLPLGFIFNITWISALFFIFGFALVVFEMFVPGFGAPGITGGVLLLFGVLLTAGSIIEAAFMILIIIAILGIMLAIAFKSATKGRLSKSMILNDSLKREGGYSSNENLSSFLGREGTTLSTLRPAGAADFDGIKQDVVSEGQYIPKDARVKVIKIEGRRVVVKQLSPPAE